MTLYLNRCNNLKFQLINQWLLKFSVIRVPLGFPLCEPQICPVLFTKKVFRRLICSILGWALGINATWKEKLRFSPRGIVRFRFSWLSLLVASNKWSSIYRLKNIPCILFFEYTPVHSRYICILAHRETRRVLLESLFYSGFSKQMHVQSHECRLK